MKRGNSRLLSISYIRELFYNAASKSYGFNYHEIAALVYIKAKGTVSQNMLVKRLRMDKSSVTKIVNKFVNAGLVTRDFDPMDLRYRVIVPTEKLFQTHLPECSFTDCFYDYVFQDCTKEELDVFYRIISRGYNRAKNEVKDEFVDLIKYVDQVETQLRQAGDDPELTELDVMEKIATNHMDD